MRFNFVNYGNERMMRKLRIWNPESGNREPRKLKNSPNKSHLSHYQLDDPWGYKKQKSHKRESETFDEFARHKSLLIGSILAKNEWEGEVGHSFGIGVHIRHIISDKICFICSLKRYPVHRKTVQVSTFWDWPQSLNRDRFRITVAIIQPGQKKWAKKLHLST